uniref:Olfactory receptor n=1 Tax=Naja naja TaxID=35670 RepID=A0A8C6XA52_NAJNA
MWGSNRTMINEFILLGFTNQPTLQRIFIVFLFLFFLSIYLITLVGNMVIILVIRADPQLYTPMYFFLINLSFLDICFSSVTVPKMLQNLLATKKTISLCGCIAQVFFFIFMFGTEIFLLSAMAYDRYAAICYPLRYSTIINHRLCIQMVLAAWLSIIYSTLHTLNILFLPFCGPNNIGQIFCELTHTLKLVCANTYGNEMAIFICAIIFGIIFSSSVIVSYVRIILTIKKIPSAQGRHKAFSTCFPHLAVFSLFMSTGMLTYLKKNSESSITEILASLLYSIVSPVANPVIYSLRNKEIKTALEKLINKIFYYRKLFSIKSC